MKTLNELRFEFEDMAKSSIFDIERLPNGEYKYEGRCIFLFWAGYWQCAKKNGVIPKDSDALKMNDW